MIKLLIDLGDYLLLSVSSISISIGIYFLIFCLVKRRLQHLVDSIIAIGFGAGVFYISYLRLTLPEL